MQGGEADLALRSPLPLGRVTAAMKTGNHYQGFVFDHKEQRIGKPAQKGAAHILKDDWKLSRVHAHSLYQSVYRRAKTAAWPGASLSYQSCASINSARAA
jgi:hypothetical protein